jgi:hypothetical protein
MKDWTLVRSDGLWAQSIPAAQWSERLMGVGSSHLGTHRYCTSGSWGYTSKAFYSVQKNTNIFAQLNSSTNRVSSIYQDWTYFCI